MHLIVLYLQLTSRSAKFVLWYKQIVQVQIMGLMTVAGCGDVEKYLCVRNREGQLHDSVLLVEIEAELTSELHGYGWADGRGGLVQRLDETFGYRSRAGLGRHPRDRLLRSGSSGGYVSGGGSVG